jgi:hypothetical protein
MEQKMSSLQKKNIYSSNQAVSLKVAAFYLFVGVSLLTLILFPPAYLKASVEKLPWASQKVLPTETVNISESTQQNFIQPAAIKQDYANNASCFAWNDLDPAQLNTLSSLLEDNPLAQNFSSKTNVATFGVAVTIPADNLKRAALLKAMASKGITNPQETRLPNGFKAWSIGSAKDMQNAELLKDALLKSEFSGFLLTAFPRQIKSSVTFQSQSAQFINQLNLFSKDKKLPQLSQVACQK